MYNFNLYFLYMNNIIDKFFNELSLILFLDFGP